MNAETAPNLRKLQQKTLDEVATLIQSLTYGEMMELSKPFGKVNRRDLL